MRYLIDTNIWIVYLKERNNSVREHLQNRKPSDIAICSVVLAELLHGARKYGNSQAREEKVCLTLAPYVSLPFDDAAAGCYAQIRDNLERRGEIIGGNDLMIAGIALAHDLVLVTNNTGEFQRVPGLETEDWSI